MKKKIVQSIVLIFLTSMLSAQTNWEFNSQRVGNIKFENTISDAKIELNKYFNVEETDFGGFLVYDGKERILTVIAKLNTDEIGAILILTDKFQTQNGLKIGLTIEEIEKFRSDFFLEYDESSGSECFIPEEFQITEGDSIKRKVKFYFRGKTNAKLGNYEFDKGMGKLRKSYDNNGAGFVYLISIELVK